MLANLTISRWQARKTDKKVSREVVTQHGAASSAGDFRKTLIDKAHLAPLQASASEIRAFHYRMTLPWDDDGRRILPSALFAEYTGHMRTLKCKDEEHRKEFFVKYPQLVAEARRFLGSMYDPEDFPAPSDLPSKFDVRISMEPIPNAADFRVDVVKEAVDEIRAEIEAENQSKFKAAEQDLHARLTKTAQHLVDTLSQDKPRIFDSLMGNVTELTSAAPALNLTGNIILAEATKQLDELVCSPAQLRVSEWHRKTTAERAAKVLETLARY